MPDIREYSLPGYYETSRTQSGVGKMLPGLSGFYYFLGRVGILSHFAY